MFVATNYALADTPGGQQICSREYLEVLEAAGFALERVEFASANRLKEKLLRRIDRRPYRYFVPADLADRVTARARETGAGHVFLNTVDLAPLATQLKRRNSAVKIVLLSHGLESVDFVHTLRIRDWRGDSLGLRTDLTLKLGRQLIEECKQRAHIDAVLCLAPFEAEIERWLGARRVLVVPRIVRPSKVDWAPVPGRVGFVGRLDHPPNLEGLLLVLDCLATQDTSRLDVRLAGAPEDFGAKLASRFAFVSYLGAVPDEALLSEVATWTCATNPIFCYARGASTKLAVMAGWGIPLVTTPQGDRGYEWRAGGPMICETAETFAAAVQQLAHDSIARTTAQQCILRALESPLGHDEIATRVRRFLTIPATEPLGVE